MPAAPITPDEKAEVFAHESPANVRLGALLGPSFTDFHAKDATWAYMLEEGFISEEVYTKARTSRFSYTQKLPAKAIPDYIKAVGEAKNSVPLLAMVSQAAGVRRRGDNVEAVLRSQVPGMSSDTIAEVIATPQVQNEMSMRGGMEMLELAAAKKVEEGSWESEESKKFVELSREYQAMVKRILGDTPSKKSKQAKAAIAAMAGGEES